jgi:hypothetical protein
MDSHTPLYYCTCAGLNGLSFHVGAVALFTPTESDTVYVVPAGATLIITARVPPPMEGFLRETVEKRLRNLGNGGWGRATALRGTRP